jgi:hypothetical protein
MLKPTMQMPGHATQYKEGVAGGEHQELVALIVIPAVAALQHTTLLA